MTLISKIIYKLNQLSLELLNKFYSSYAKFRLKNIEFSIICNNCFGGHLYESLNRLYNTPTVGLYFFAEDFIKFIERLEDYLEEDINFIKESRYAACHKEHKRKNYPIGLLSNNLEIHFLHYKSEEEAKLKWNRRKSRILKNKILIISNDQNGFTNDMMNRFDQVSYAKVFLSSKERKGKTVKVISHYRGKENVGDMYKDKLKCLKDFDLVTWVKKQNI